MVSLMGLYICTHQKHNINTNKDEFIAQTKAPQSAGVLVLRLKQLKFLDIRMYEDFSDLTVILYLLKWRSLSMYP